MLQSTKAVNSYFANPKRRNVIDIHTLTQYSNIAKWLSDVLGKPVAFLFDNHIYHEENIMPNNRGVYFIYSNEYAFLPFLFENLTKL